MPLFDCGVNSTVPVTISGCWNSSPSFFQVLDVGEDRLEAGQALLVADARHAGRGLRAVTGRVDRLGRRLHLGRHRLRLGRGGLRRRGRRRLGRGARILVHLLGDLGEREHVRFDHAQARPRAELAAEQPDRLEVGVDVVRAAGDEADDVHPLERRHVELRLDRRLDRNLVEADAARRDEGERERPRPERHQPASATGRRCGSPDH